MSWAIRDMNGRYTYKEMLFRDKHMQKSVYSYCKSPHLLFTYYSSQSMAERNAQEMQELSDKLNIGLKFKTEKLDDNVKFFTDDSDIITEYIN